MGIIQYVVGSHHLVILMVKDVAVPDIPWSCLGSKGNAPPS